MLHEHEHEALLPVRAVLTSPCVLCWPRVRRAHGRSYTGTCHGFWGVEQLPHGTASVAHAAELLRAAFEDAGSEKKLA